MLLPPLAPSPGFLLRQFEEREKRQIVSKRWESYSWECFVARTEHGRRGTCVVQTHCGPLLLPLRPLQWPAPRQAPRVMASDTGLHSLEPLTPLY